MVIQNLLDLYNFLPISQLPLLQVDFHRVDNYPPIQQILTRICCFTDDIMQSEQISQSYMLLNQFIRKEEETLGPKRFKKLVQSVFTIILQYLLNVLREQSQQKSSVYFHLTYYRKNCSKYVDSYFSCCMMTVSIITGYKLEQWTGMQEKVKQLRLGLKQLSRNEQYYSSSIILNRLCSLIQACTFYHLAIIKKAKDLCSKIINTSSLESITAIKCHKQPSLIVKLQLTICSYTVMKIYQQMGNYQLHTFMMNKFLQYAQKFYSGGQIFLELVGRGELREKEVRVKLTRLQEKIRRIDLTEQEEYNKYLIGYKMKSKKKALSRSSSLYSVQQQSSTLTKTASNLSRPNHVLSLHKQSDITGIQRQSVQKQSQLHNFTSQQKKKKPSIVITSIVKGKQSATNKLKLTKRGMNITNMNNTNKSTTSNNKFESNIVRSCSVSSFHNIDKFAVTQPIKINKQIINPTQQQIQLKKANQHKLQLQNLLILKDNKKNYYQLKQQTIRYLNKQSNQLKRMIRIKNNQIKQMEHIKTQLNSQLNLQQLKRNIQLSKQQQELLLKQIQANKWNYLQSYPQVKKINTYFKTFLTTLTYWHSKNVYSLVHGEMFNLSQMKMITTLRQRAQKRNKQVISQVVYRNIKHQVQYIKQQLPDSKFSYIMSIYQTQKGQNGINLQFQLSQQQYKIVKYQPFYYNYSIFQDKLIPFQKQLLQLSLKSIYYLHKFIKKIKRNCLRYQNQFTYKCYHIGFNYQNGIQIISTKEKDQINNNSLKYAFIGKYLLTIKQISIQNKQKISTLQVPTNKQFYYTTQKTNNFLQTYSISSNFLQIQSKFHKTPKQQEPSKNLQVTIQKISKNQYKNQNYNHPLFVKIIVTQKEYNELQILKSALTKQMDSIFINHQEKIVLIQKLFRKILATKKLQQRKKQTKIQTYQHKNIIYTLVTNLYNNKSNFFIQQIPHLINQTQNNSQVITQNDHKKFLYHRLQFPILIRHNVSFHSLDFLPRLQPRLQQSNNFEEMYIRIQKFIKIKLIAGKIFSKSKDIRFFTDFQTQFKKKLCFATIKDQFLFRGKMRQGRIMYMLTVKQFSRMPRPYSLKIFTLESNTMISIDGQKIIYNKEKLFLESKLQTINQVIEILGRNQFQIHTKTKMQPIMKKTPSRISILSNYSFHSAEPSRQHIDEKASSGGINRRLSKNSMFAKFRHKALIKNQDLEAIKKLVEERNLNRSQSLSSNLSSQLSIVEPVMSDSSQDKGTDQKSS